MSENVNIFSKKRVSHIQKKSSFIIGTFFESVVLPSFSLLSLGAAPFSPLFRLGGVALPASSLGVAFSLLLLRGATVLLLLWVGLLSPHLLLGGAARHQPKRGKMKRRKIEKYFL